MRITAGRLPAERAGEAGFAAGAALLRAAGMDELIMLRKCPRRGNKRKPRCYDVGDEGDVEWMRLASLKRWDHRRAYAGSVAARFK